MRRSLGFLRMAGLTIREAVLYPGCFSRIHPDGRVERFATAPPSPLAARHERLRRSAQALVEAHKAYLDREPGDWMPWHNLQRAEMATRHALDDELALADGKEFVCPCGACQEIGGVGQ